MGTQIYNQLCSIFTARQCISLHKAVYVYPSAIGKYVLPATPNQRPEPGDKAGRTSTGNVLWARGWFHLISSDSYVKQNPAGLAQYIPPLASTEGLHNRDLFPTLYFGALNTNQVIWLKQPRVVVLEDLPTRTSDSTWRHCLSYSMSACRNPSDTKASYLPSMLIGLPAVSPSETLLYGWLGKSHAAPSNKLGVYHQGWLSIRPTYPNCPMPTPGFSISHFNKQSALRIVKLCGVPSIACTLEQRLLNHVEAS